MRILSCVALAACGTSSSDPPVATSPRAQAAAGLAPVLAIEDLGPGRLVFDRSGTPWQLTCDGTRLGKRAWEGGPRVDVAACDEPDGVTDEATAPSTRPAVAIEGDTVALWSSHQHAIVVTRGGVDMQRYPVSEHFDVVAVAIDGDAVIAVVVSRGSPGGTVGPVGLDRSLAALVRLDHDRGTLHELVRYGSTGPAVTPQFVSAGKDHMLLVSRTGGTLVCDYAMSCGEPHATNLGEVYRHAVLPDGGMLALRWEHHVSRIDAHGNVVWTTDHIEPIALIGATASHVWYETRSADRQHGVIRALSLADGRLAGDVATEIVDRDRHGRLLSVSAVAATPIGTVARGVFGGTLAAGTAVVETRTLGAVCWQQLMPHGVHEYSIDVAGTCDDEHAKALVTEKKPFRSVGAESLRAVEREVPGPR